MGRKRRAGLDIIANAAVAVGLGVTYEIEFLKHPIPFLCACSCHCTMGGDVGEARWGAREFCILHDLMQVVCAKLVAHASATCVIEDYVGDRNGACRGAGAA